MLKYQIRTSKCSPRGTLPKCPESTSSTINKPSCSDQNPVQLRHRSNSLTSLSSVDSGESSEWGTLKVYTGNINPDTDYKTLKISTSHTAKNVIDTILGKFRISCRDPNLFEIFMEVRTKINGDEVKSLLLLNQDARPLELQRCHPAQMSRFFLSMSENGVLVRIYDYLISPQSNYKSLLLSMRTTCYEAIALLLAMDRNNGDPNDFRLYISNVNRELQMGETVADLYKALHGDHKILIRRFP
uniref:Ras-associating domain-containing protein n=1 Tax=Syphacia muris TaxID=451379 RepID=A0A0N5ARR9_9BILA